VFKFITVGSLAYSNVAFLSSTAAAQKSKSKFSEDGSTGAFIKPRVVIPNNFGRAMDRKSPMTKALNALENAVEHKDVVLSLRICTSLKRSGLKPTAQFYRLLMQLFVAQNMFLETIAVFDDAVMTGVTPDIEMWNYLLEVKTSYPILPCFCLTLQCRPVPGIFSCSQKPLMQ
jgi:hypothetical protein